MCPTNTSAHLIGWVDPDFAADLDKVSHRIYTHAELGSRVMEINETEKRVIEHGWIRMVYGK